MFFRGITTLKKKIYFCCRDGNAHPLTSTTQRRLNLPRTWFPPSLPQWRAATQQRHRYEKFKTASGPRLCTHRDPHTEFFSLLLFFYLDSIWNIFNTHKKKRGKGSPLKDLTGTQSLITLLESFTKLLKREDFPPSPPQPQPKKKKKKKGIRTHRHLGGVVRIKRPRHGASLPS